MDLSELLKDRKGIVYAAIERYSDYADIKEFYSSYVAYMGQNKKSQLAKIDYEEAAKRNIVYALQTYDSKIQKRWLEAIPGLEALFNKLNEPEISKVLENLNRPKNTDNE